MDPTTKRSLTRRLKELDALRNTLAKAEAREKALAAELIEDLQSLDLLEYDFDAGRRARIVQTHRTTIPVHVFCAVAPECGLTAEQIERCTRTEIRVGEARSLLGDVKVDAIADVQPNAPTLRIVSTRT